MDVRGNSGNAARSDNGKNLLLSREVRTVKLPMLAPPLSLSPE